MQNNKGEFIISNKDLKNLSTKYPLDENKNISYLNSNGNKYIRMSIKGTPRAEVLMLYNLDNLTSESNDKLAASTFYIALDENGENESAVELKDSEVYFELKSHINELNAHINPEDELQARIVYEFHNRG